jgi:bifunctional DNA-binding transcriptional regulator/antitoxin component of YhaV-PrlF toxin-antitoxin module
MTSQTFYTIILGGELKNVAGIEVPPSVIAELNAGQRPRLAVDVKGYRYTNTVGKMGGKFLISLSAEHRKASGLSVGDKVEVTVALAGDEQAAEVPLSLAEALTAANARDSFDKAAPSKRREWIRQVFESKTVETRDRRIKKIVDGFMNDKG